jgi:hypothetical protein
MKSFGRLSPQRLGSAGVTLALLGALALIPWRVVAETPSGVQLIFVPKGAQVAGGDLFNLARRPDVQSHLQLSPAQTKAFAELQQQWREAESEQGDEEALARLSPDGQQLAKEATQATPAAAGQAPQTKPAAPGFDPRLQQVRDHLRRYRDLAAQGHWSEAGRELEAIESLVK